MRRAIWVGILAGIVSFAGAGRMGAAGQQNGVPLPGPPFPDSTIDARSHRGEDPGDTEERRQMEAKRAGAANAERQKLIVQDATLIVQAAAEAQLKLTKDDGASRQDALRELDTVAKLAHTVKDKMKYTR
jgi:hypothetical protein